MVLLLYSWTWSRQCMSFSVILILFLNFIYYTQFHKIIFNSPVKPSSSRVSNSVQLSQTGRFVSVQELLKMLEKSPRGVCKCQREYNLTCFANSPFVDSSCSVEASLAGLNQKVLSYSLFNLNDNQRFTERYLPGIGRSIRGRNKFYPDWVIRIYYRLELTPDICELVCSDSQTYFCDVTNLPILGNIQYVHPRTGRFVPLGDSTVEKFVSRDLDSSLSLRERIVVEQWEKSLYIFHGMRDHRLHGAGFMAGMWGVDNYRLNLRTGRKLRAEILNVNWKKFGMSDQDILTEVLYKKYKSSSLIHDSYFCKFHKDSIPFPSRRKENMEFVGQIIWPGHDNPLHNLSGYPCPYECRPEYGKDWIYC